MRFIVLVSSFRSMRSPRHRCFGKKNPRSTPGSGGIGRFWYHLHCFMVVFCSALPRSLLGVFGWRGRILWRRRVLGAVVRRLRKTYSELWSCGDDGVHQVCYRPEFTISSHSFANSFPPASHPGSPASMVSTNKHVISHRGVTSWACSSPSSPTPTGSFSMMATACSPRSCSTSGSPIRTRRFPL